MAQARGRLPGAGALPDSGRREEGEGIPGREWLGQGRELRRSSRTASSSQAGILELTWWVVWQRSGQKRKGKGECLPGRCCFVSGTPHGHWRGRR